MGSGSGSQADDALVAAEGIQERTIQEQALAHVPGAIKTLGKFAKGQQVNKLKPTAQVTRSAARDIIEFAGGRPETRDPRIGDGSQNLTIVIQRFGDGTMTKINPNAPIDVEELDPLALAEEAKRSVVREFEVPDVPAEYVEED